jgi:hypothetical protein
MRWDNSKGKQGAGHTGIVTRRWLDHLQMLQTAGVLAPLYDIISGIWITCREQSGGSRCVVSPGVIYLQRA